MSASLARLRENLIDLDLAIAEADVDLDDPQAVALITALTAQYRRTRQALQRDELREVPRG